MYILKSTRPITAEQNMTIKKVPQYFIKENQMQLKLLITFKLRRTGIQNRVTSDWEVPLPTNDPDPRGQNMRYPFPFRSRTTHASPQKRHNQAQRTCGGNRCPDSLPPCADDCSPWCMFRADYVRGILYIMYIYTSHDKRLKKNKEALKRHTARHEN